MNVHRSTMQARRDRLLRDLADGCQYESFDEMAQVYGVSANTISRDVQALERAGLVTVERNSARAIVASSVRARQWTPEGVK